MSSLEPLKTMRRGGSRMCASVPHAFHQHLHQSPCVVCESAEAALISGAKDAASASLGSSLINAPSSNSVPSKRAANAAARPTCASSRPTSSLSLVELRRDALLRWLQTFSDEEQLHGVPGSSGANSDGGRTLTSSEAFDACYSAYLTSDDPQAQKDLFHTLLETLDQQCSRTDVRQGGAEWSSRPLPSHTESLSSVRIPTRLVVPDVNEGGVSTSGTPLQSINRNNSKTPANVFEAHVRELFPSDAVAVTKQLAFQEALLSIKAVLDQQRIPFFLACGTALGARRDGCFIPYDEDIDLGILYAELCSSGAEETATKATPASMTDTLSSSQLQRVQDRLYCLINALASTGAFFVFDVCGTVEKGLELRILHTSTNTRIDINLYYPPVPNSDDALVQAKGPFLWASSFYEAASQRRHQMYRYRHQPFDKELTKLPFCVRTSEAGGFWVPPERYLVENYGSDWKTPKQYTYTEGLAEGFKNIIDE